MGTCRGAALLRGGAGAAGGAGPPSLRGIVGFDWALLCERYLAPFALAKKDPSLLQRAVAFLSASGDVLHYGHVEALRDRVFLRPQWLVDCMAALVRHDLEPRLAALHDDSLLPDGLAAEQAQELGRLFVERGVLDRSCCVLGRICSRTSARSRAARCAGGADGDGWDHSPWTASETTARPLAGAAAGADGPVPLPPEWAVAGDPRRFRPPPAPSSVGCSTLERRAFRRACRQVLYCTLVGMTGETLVEGRAAHSAQHGATSLPFVLTIEQSGSKSCCRPARRRRMRTACCCRHRRQADILTLVAGRFWLLRRGACTPMSSPMV